MFVCVVLHFINVSLIWWRHRFQVYNGYLRPLIHLQSLWSRLLGQAKGTEDLPFMCSTPLPTWNRKQVKLTLDFKPLLRVTSVLFISYTFEVNNEKKMSIDKLNTCDKKGTTFFYYPWNMSATFFRRICVFKTMHNHVKVLGSI